MKTKFIITVCVLATLALIAGKFCLNLKTGPQEAAAAINFDQSELTIVLAPEKNIFEQKKRYHYITDYLSSKLGIPVNAEILPDYAEICKAFVEDKADIGFFGSLSYGLVHANASAEPIARPVWLDDSSTYSGYLVVNKNSGIKTVEDMRGKRLALVHKATTAGYIFPLEYFRNHGVESLENFFSTILFCGSHDAAAWAVYSGEADVGACKNHVFNSLRENDSEFNEQMLILAESQEVPSNGMAVKKDLNPYLKVRLKEILLNMNKTNEGREALKGFKAKKFIDTSDADYKPLYKMINDIGIDLKSYLQDR